jgi:hypothetical protein
MHKPVEARSRRVDGGGKDDQDGPTIAVAVGSPAAAEDAFAVLPENLRVAVGVVRVRPMQRHLTNSGEPAAES